MTVVEAERTLLSFRCARHPFFCWEVLSRKIPISRVIRPSPSSSSRNTDRPPHCFARCLATSICIYFQEFREALTGMALARFSWSGLTSCQRRRGRRDSSFAAFGYLERSVDWEPFCSPIDDCLEIMPQVLLVQDNKQLSRDFAFDLAYRVSSEWLVSVMTLMSAERWWRSGVAISHRDKAICHRFVCAPR